MLGKSVVSKQKIKSDLKTNFVSEYLLAIFTNVS